MDHRVEAGATLFQQAANAGTNEEAKMTNPESDFTRRSGSCVGLPRGSAGKRSAAGSGRRGRFGFFLCRTVAIATILSGAMASATLAQLPRPNARLVELTEQYLRTPDDGERRRLLDDIEKLAHGSVKAVSLALRAANVWEPRSPGVSSFSLATPGGQTLQVAYKIPKPYDNAKRYPLIVAPPDGPESPERTLSRVARILGALTEAFVVVVVPEQIALGHDSTGSALTDLLRAVRRQIHVDTDRVFLIGVNNGADAAWMIAIQTPDLFAGVLCLSGYPNYVYPAQMYPIVLSNLERLPVLSVWGNITDSTTNGRQRAVAAHNQLISSLAAPANISFTGIAVSASDVASMAIPPRPLQEMLSRRRSDVPTHAMRWFRYPAHGRAAWCRQTRFKGNVWTANQLSILPTARVDHDGFVDAVIKSKLAYLSGAIEGQTITLETCRCARVELLLPDGLIDFTESVTVICNGRRRHRGTLEPSIGTMLEYARDEWVFRKLPVAKLTISVRTDHDFGQTDGVINPVPAITPK